MSSSRLATSLLTRSTRASAPRAIRQIRTPLCARLTTNPTTISKPISQFRAYSQEAPPPSKPSKIYFFQDVRSLTTSTSSPKAVLIDTREPSELHSTGTIPGSLNIPITTSPEAFFLSASEFEDKFGFERPGKEQEVVFYCKAGVRSRAAAEIAKRAGWEKVGEYSGSWLDWERNGGKSEKVS